MGDGAVRHGTARHRSALRGAEPYRVMTNQALPDILGVVVLDAMSCSENMRSVN